MRRSSSDRKAGRRLAGPPPGEENQVSRSPQRTSRAPQRRPSTLHGANPGPGSVALGVLALLAAFAVALAAILLF
jgi:hypothetical protein